jgi:hypothetical protein
MSGRWREAAKCNGSLIYPGSVFAGPAVGAILPCIFDAISRTAAADTMKFRELLRFSLELILPQRALVAFARRAAGPREASEAHPQAEADAHISTGHAATRGIDSTKHDGSTSDGRPLIAELDSAHFGGPSFGEQSIAMMAEALDDVLAALPPPVAVSTKRELAANILKRAADGERNPDRLRKAVLGELFPPKANI